MSGRRRFRPGSGHVFGMMLANALATLLILPVIFALFGVHHVDLPLGLASHHWAQAVEWQSFWPLLPGAAICFGCLWFWLILTGRTRGLSWGSALVYGVFIALFDVPLRGFLTGALNGDPLTGLLIGLVVVFLLPALLLSMLTFGVLMGALNGWLAQGWIKRHVPRT